MALGVGSKDASATGPESAPRDTRLCQPQTRRNPYCTLGSKTYSDNLSRKKESTEKLQMYFGACNDGKISVLPCRRLHVLARMQEAEN